MDLTEEGGNPVVPDGRYSHFNNNKQGGGGHLGQSPSFLYITHRGLA